MEFRGEANAPCFYGAQHESGALAGSTDDEDVAKALLILLIPICQVLHVAPEFQQTLSDLLMQTHVHQAREAVATYLQ